MRLTWRHWLAWLAILTATVLAWAQDLAVSAKVDKTTVTFGDPIHLTLTATGDLAGLELQQIELPEQFLVAARSQATNFTIRGGVQERALSFTYVIIPQEGGTFILGPFKFTQNKHEYQTEPIEIIVEKPAVPPNLPTKKGERYTL